MLSHLKKRKDYSFNVFEAEVMYEDSTLQQVNLEKDFEDDAT